MTQPSGRILGLPSSYNFAIRSSPFVCAVSTIYSLSCFLFYCFRLRSFKKARRRFTAERFSDRANNGEVDPLATIFGLKLSLDGTLPLESVEAFAAAHSRGWLNSAGASFASLRNNVIFRIGLFLVGALPQIIKLYAADGIPWTQAICTAFLSSFLVDELLLRGPPCHDEIFLATIYSASSTGASLMHSLSWISIVFTFVFTPVDARLLGWTEQYGSGWVCFGVIVWQCISNILICQDRYIREHDARFFFAEIVLFWDVISILNTLGYLAIAEYFHLQSRWPFFTWEVLKVGGVICRVILMSNVEREVRADNTNGVGMLTRHCAICYVLFHLVEAVICYAGLYDASKTFKPAWTAWMG